MPGAEEFGSGTLGGIRRPRVAAAADRALDGLLRARGVPRRLARAAAAAPPRRRVLALAVDRPGRDSLLGAARRELERSRHEVELHEAEAGDRGKFPNLNALLAEHPPDRHDWLLVLDDDVELPRPFLDPFLLLAERLGFTLAQPAHRIRSHAAWRVVTRRRPGLVARRTAFVEIGPVTAFARDAFEALLPFPALRFGWGLDLHWGAIARARDWRLGVIDALPVAHGLRPVGATYSREAAIAEARAFLATRPHLTAAEAQQTLAAYRGWR